MSAEPDTSTAIEFSVPDEHPCFAGHFPDDPLVPGALLLTWCLQQLQRQQPALAVAGVRLFKFLHPVRPGDRLRLEVGSRSGTRLPLTLYCNGHTAGKGSLECHP